MGIENISTGYKPEFALGALYHGFNAGSQDNASQLANLIQEQALQKSRLEDPYKVLEAMLAGNRANVMNTPEMLDRYASGLGGEYDSRAVKGRTDQALEGSDIISRFTKNMSDASGNANIGTYNEVVGGAMRGLPETGQIGFPMTASPRNENYGNEGRGLTPLPILKNEAVMKQSFGDDYYTGSQPYDLQTIDQEIARTKDPKILATLQEERARIVQELASGGGGFGTPNGGAVPMVSGGEGTQQPQTGSNLDKMRALLGNDPAHWGKMELQRQKGIDAVRAAGASGSSADARIASQERNKDVGLIMQYDKQISDIDAKIATLNNKDLQTQLIRDVMTTENMDQTAASKAVEARIKAQLTELGTNKKNALEMRNYYAKQHKIPEHTNTNTPEAPKAKYQAGATKTINGETWVRTEQGWSKQ